MASPEVIFRVAGNEAIMVARICFLNNITIAIFLLPSFLLFIYLFFKPDVAFWKINKNVTFATKVVRITSIPSVKATPASHPS